ncbi:Caffeoyl-CoA O-methyltransferase [Halothece sp. PCC 7418]|uniref:O-methyltransferase n=1 Tax=Aphanothece halophytica TaxID=72020 RepID=W8VY25_APHHA|nr:class I SAM-dependent methyltransferase [Halothece sp. PCC 7418]AFZ43284.1 Caffeoyl-CoA O-methyltransferase [Halothece sp. PCC 7418]BAO51914.1 O-methyltransferase [Aphanothece halophytica]
MTITNDKPSQKTARPVTPLGILVQQLEQIVEQGKEEGISSQLQSAIESAYELGAGLDPYLEQITTQESEALANLDRKTREEDWSQSFSDGETVRRLEQEMLSGHIEGQTLKMFVHMTGAKRILEVGMFTGYSALAMAEALPENGRVVALEVDPYTAQLGRNCFDVSPHGQKIEIMVDSAINSMKKLAADGQTFQLAFLDADKTEYKDYYRLLLDEGLLEDGGYIFVDNSLLQGQAYLPPEKRTLNGDAIAQFNQMVADDPRVEQVLLPLRDGLTMIRKL